MPEFTILELPAQRVAAHKMHCRYEEVGPGFALLCRKVGGRASGKPFTLYHEMQETQEAVDLECCIPVKESMQPKDGIEIRQIEGGRFLVCTHAGPYDKLKDTYCQVMGHIEKEGLKVVPPIREVYVKGPGMIFKGNPEKYVTEIQVQLGEA